MSIPVWKFIIWLCLQLFGPLYAQLKSIIKRTSCLEDFFANQPEKLRPLPAVWFLSCWWIRRMISAR